MFASSRIAAVSAGFESFTHLIATTSTNVVLGEQARDGNTAPAVLVTDHQTEGRGRMGRVWQDDPGAQLLVSFRFAADPASASELASSVGIAAHEAAQEVLAVNVGMKWPNDLVVVDGPAPGKLAGLLAEYISGPPDTVIVGIGLNVSAISVPGATSLAESGSVATRDEVLAKMIDALAVLRDAGSSIRRELVSRSATIGTDVRVERHRDELVGRAVGIDESGCLLVDDGTEVHVVRVGDIVHLRSVP